MTVIGRNVRFHLPFGACAVPIGYLRTDIADSPVRHSQEVCLIPRRLLIGLTALAAAIGGGIAFGPADAASPGGGECVLNGSATFAPNGPGTQDTFGYSFNGDLSNCESNRSAPSSGSISAGEVVTIGNANYQEPRPSGSTDLTGAGASCAEGVTNGTAIVTWADGTHTVIDYETHSVAAGVALDGSVVPSVTLQNTDPTSLAPATVTITSNSPAFDPGSDGAAGLLTFQVSDPTECTTDSGVSVAGITGVVGVGGPSPV
jgi:hypothetical protein